MKYHLFLTIFGKVVKIKQTSFLLSKCLVSIAHHCRLVNMVGARSYKYSGGSNAAERLNQVKKLARMIAYFFVTNQVKRQIHRCKN